MWWWRRGML